MNVNFILPGEGRKPSVFAAACMFALAALGRILAQYVALPIVFLVSRLTGGLSADAQNTIAQALYYALFIALPVAVYVKKRPSAPDAMRVNPIAPSSALLCALAAVAGTFFIMYVNYLWLMLLEALGATLSNADAAVPANTRELAGAIVFTAILPGLCEEVLFRGAILGAWEEKGSVRALFITSVLFTLLHSSIQGIPSQMLAGLILGIVVISTNSLFAGMIYHTVHNAVCLILAYAGSGARLTQEEMEMSTYQLIGGAQGVISLLMNILVFGLILFFLLRRIDKRRLREERFAFGLPAQTPAREAGWSELAVICAGVVMACAMYLVNFFELAGLIS